MQLVLQVSYLLFGLSGSEAQEDLMLLLLYKCGDASVLCWIKEQRKSE